MAAAASPNYECSICLDIFDNPEMLIKCGHSFCASCIGKSIQLDGTVCCPQCRAITRVPIGGQLPPNISLRQLADDEKNLREVRQTAADSANNFHSEVSVVGEKLPTPVTTEVAIVDVVDFVGPSTVHREVLYDSVEKRTFVRRCRTTAEIDQID